jgi:cytochrome b561
LGDLCGLHLPRYVAKVIHFLLYPVLIAIPLAGLNPDLKVGSGKTLLGIPRLLGQTEELAESLASIHSKLLVAIAAMVLPHVAAALCRQHFRMMRRSDE